MIDKIQEEDSKLVNPADTKISRRKLLASLGLAGAAVAAGGILSNKVYGQTVTNSVYGQSALITTSTNGGIYNVKDYGAIGNGSANDYDAIQLAINTCNINGGGTVFFPRAKYNVGGSIIINHGAPNSSITLDGNNSLLTYTGTSEALIKINPVNPVSQGPSGNGITHFEIKNFDLASNQNSGTHIGIDIGIEGFNVDDFAWSLIENVRIGGFNKGIQVVSSRHITFKDVVIRNPISNCLVLQSTGNFCGDMNFFGCEFVGGLESTVKLYAWGNDENAQLRGIHFSDCVIYGRSEAVRTWLFSSSGSGKIFDVWLNHCAFDQGNNYALQFDAQHNSEIGYININNTYVVGFTKFLEMSNSSTKTNGNIVIRGCMINMIPVPFNIYNFSNLILEGNFFNDASGKSYFSGAVKNIQFINNRFNGANLIPACINLQPTVQSGIIKNNFGNYSSSFVENQTTLGSNKLIIEDNLQTLI